MSGEDVEVTQIINYFVSVLVQRRSQNARNVREDVDNVAQVMIYSSLP